jgi:type 1 fimbria pilin
VTVGSTGGGTTGSNNPYVKPNDPAHDGDAKEFEIYKNGKLLITTSNGNSFWLATGLSAGQTNTFHFVAVYPDGAKSAKAGPVTLTQKP